MGRGRVVATNRATDPQPPKDTEGEESPLPPVTEDPQLVERLVDQVDVESAGLALAQALVLEQELQDFTTGSIGTKHRVTGTVMLPNGTLAEITMHVTLVLKDSLKNRHRR